MCLEAVKVFEKPVKEMIGWKVLAYEDGKYATPFREKKIKKNQKFLIARGKKDVRKDWGTTSYYGGFIHAHRSREIARIRKYDLERII